MTFWQHLFWLGEMAIDVSVLVLPVAIVLLLLGLGGQHWRDRLSATGPWPWAILLAQLLVTPAILALGVLGACESCSPMSVGQGVRHPWAGTATDMLLLGQFLSALVVLFKYPGQRGAAAVLQSVLFWSSLSAAFAAGMSISGDWL